MYTLLIIQKLPIYKSQKKCKVRDIQNFNHHLRFKKKKITVNSPKNSKNWYCLRADLNQNESYTILKVSGFSHFSRYAEILKIIFGH